MARGETKTKLLEVGRDVFSERGYNHAGIDAMLEGVGGSEGVVLQLFLQRRKTSGFR